MPETERFDANRAHSRARALLAGVRPGHAPRNGYGHRISAHLRAAYRSHPAPKIGHEAVAHPTSNRTSSRPKAVRSRLLRALHGWLVTSQCVPHCQNPGVHLGCRSCWSAAWADLLPSALAQTCGEIRQYFVRGLIKVGVAV